jgi:hypothetical protein
MRYFAMFLMMLSVCMFSIGCGETKKTPEKQGTGVEKKEPGATTPAEGKTPSESEPAEPPA